MPEDPSLEQGRVQEEGGKGKEVEEGMGEGRKGGKRRGEERTSTGRKWLYLKHNPRM